jgi:hypothetical protein
MVERPNVRWSCSYRCTVDIHASTVPDDIGRETRNNRVARSTVIDNSGITYIIQTYITEPISTFFRFLHLALLFGPVILTSPMLLVGSTKASRRLLQRGAIGQGEDVERWGAVWWYGFLVAQMERAGPTFIKVSLLISLQLRTQPRERHAEDALSNIS